MIKIRRIVSEILIVSGLTIAPLGGSSASDYTPVMPAGCVANPRLARAYGQCILPICCCPSIACNNPDAAQQSNANGQADDPKRGAKTSQEAEQISRLADITLKGVAEHSEFLAALWKWSTIVGGVVVGLLAIFGIKSILDVKTLEEQARRGLDENQQAFKQLRADQTANHKVMMTSCRAELSIDLATELERKAKKSGVIAVEKNECERQAIEKFKSAREDLGDVLRKNEAKDPAVGSWAYNLYGYTQYKLGDFSEALAAVKKSLAFIDANATAQYNAACYAAKLHLSKDSVEYLQRAVKLNHTFLTDAKTEPDFDAIRSSQEFANFVGA